jgi:hypothetical protein
MTTKQDSANEVFRKIGVDISDPKGDAYQKRGRKAGLPNGEPEAPVVPQKRPQVQQ